MTNFKSMNNAITSILIGKLNFLNSWRNSFHGKLRTLLKPERVHQISYRGVANLMHPIVSVLDIDSIPLNSSSST